MTAGRLDWLANVTLTLNPAALIALPPTCRALAPMCWFNVGAIGTRRIVVVDLAVHLAYGVPPFA